MNSRSYARTPSETAPEAELSRTENSLPRAFVWTVLALCLLPCLLQTYGINLGFDPREKVAGTVLHTFFESSGAVVCVLGFIFAYLYFRIYREYTLLLIGTWLLFSALLDTLHILIVNGVLSSSSHGLEFATFSGATARGFSALLLMSGIGVSLLNRSAGAELRKGLRVSITVGAFSLLCYLWFTVQKTLPKAMYPDAVIKNPGNFLALMIYALGTVFICWPFHRWKRDIYSHTIVVGLMPTIGCMLYFSFLNGRLYDSGFNIGHFLKLLSYLVMVSGLALVYVRNFKESEKRALRLVRERDAQMRSIYDASLIGLAFGKHSGQILDANDTFLEISGYSRQELLNGNIRWHFRKWPGTVPFETEYIRSDGRPVPVYVGLTLLKDQDELFVAFILDLSELKRTQKLLAENRLKMVHASKMSALGEMAGGMAHEINNPLAIIHGRAAQLKEWGRSGGLRPEIAVQIAEKIEHTAMRITTIVKSLRAFARDGEQDPLTAMNVKAIIEETVDLCRERFRQHQILLLIDPLDENLTIECRSVQISQVLLNLLNNAHDAVADLHKKWVRISVREKDRAVEISVLDSGSGIPFEIRERILQPFFTTKEVGKGTGLGLSVSKGIIESHRGKLFLDAESPNTRFVLDLPKC